MEKDHQLKEEDHQRLPTLNNDLHAATSTGPTVSVQTADLFTDVRTVVGPTRPRAALQTPPLNPFRGLPYDHSFSNVN